MDPDGAAISATAAAALLGADTKTVTGWILAGELAAQRRADDRTPQQGGSAFRARGQVERGPS